MAATVEICESNGSSETITHSITNTNWGSTDAPNLTPASYKITVGQHSFFKLQRLHVTAMGGSTAIDNIRVWKSNGAYKTDEDIQASLNETQGNYDSVKVTAFSQPNANSYTAYTIPVAEPAKNLGIGGSLTGQLSAAGYTDYLKHQLKTGAGTPPGVANQKTISWKYDES